jgi:hypothetical protein
MLLRFVLGGSEVHILFDPMLQNLGTRGSPVRDWSCWPE